MNEDATACASDLTGISLSSQKIAPRDHHTSFVYEAGGKAYLYVVGGTDSWTTTFADVLRSPIGEGGALGAFEKIGEIPAPRAGHVSALIGKVLVVASGTDGAGMNAETWTTELSDTGALGEWKTGPKVPEELMHASLVVRGSDLYILGGRAVVGASDTSRALVARAHLDGTTLGPWTKTTQLPAHRSHHMSYLSHDFIYVLGGLHGSAMDGAHDPLKDIIRAPLDEAGDLGAWETVGNLPSTLSVTAAEVHENRVYLLGGYDEAKSSYSNRVLSADLDEEGRPVGFVASPMKLHAERAHVHQNPFYRGFMYSVGGRLLDGERSIGDIDVLAFE